MRALCATICLLLFLTTPAHVVLERSLLCSWGSISTAGSISLEATLGDLVVSSAVSPSLLATQGFQQTHPDITTSLPNEHPSDIGVFPNPTPDRLTIMLPELLAGVAQFALFDASCRSVQIAAQRMDDRFLIDLSALSSGNYFLRILRDLEPPTTIKIMKQE